MKRLFKDKKFKQASLDKIELANEIIEEYQNDGFDLTLRQLYYQFVARGLIANNDKEYKKLGCVINDARLAGLVDWSAIKDRTRHVRKQATWDSPKDIVEACSRQYHLNRWKRQHHAVEVWIEKDALVGVLDDVCRKLDVPYFSCRGYVSQSAMYEAADRMNDRDYYNSGQPTIVLHLGDHDPSGIDMTRDIQDRLDLFTTGNAEVEVKRIALTMAQINQMNPPPNPAKLTDVRAKDYVANYGNQSWELDAIEPRKLINLIEDEVDNFVDQDIWDEVVEKENEHKQEIVRVAGLIEDGDD